MTPERWQRIKEVFSAALELPPGERAAWLAAALPDDPSLVREAEELIAAHDGADDFYERGALAAVPELRRQLEGAVEGMHLGPYRVLSELGRGGVGAVYLAVRDQPGFTQKVAIKLIKRGMDTDEIVRRFVAERQILASLTHPNIARLLDGGSTPEGLPYFVMEYVEGRRITDYADERQLSVEERLHLGLHVCRAVQHAHQSLVVHRDLKPGNILVDTEGQPKLLDFGIAKLLDPGSEIAVMTAYAVGPMTPEYASPEQQSGGSITTATDVYGLGLLLYELLVGQTPRSVERLLGAGWADRPPSQALAALRAPEGAKSRRLARRFTRRFARGIAGDLDNIVGKALAPDPARRYGTAAALAEDLERHLTRRPVAARRPTLAYRLSRTVARHKAAAALASVICLLTVFSSYKVFERVREQKRFQAEVERVAALSGFLKEIVLKAVPAERLGESPTVRQILDTASEDLQRRDSRYQPEIWATLLQATGTIYENLGLYEQAETSLRRALELREKLSGSSEGGELALAETLTALGSAQLSGEDYPEARKSLERALALKERRLGPAALALAENLNALGDLAFQEGRLEEARASFDRACSISRLTLGGDQSALADCYNNLGYLAWRQEELPRAQLLFSKAFQYFRSTLGDLHPETVRVRSNLAAAMSGRGDHAGAEAHLREIVEIYKRVLEPDHPDLAGALLELAIYQHRGRRLDEARVTLDELLRIRSDYRFPHDQSEAETWNVVARIAYDAKDLDAADAAYVKSYETYRALPGDLSGPLSNILIGRARVHLLREDFPGALALARRSYELARSSGVESQDAVARAEVMLGRCYLAWGKPALARPYLERGYRALLDLYGPESPATRTAERALQDLNTD